MPEFARRERLTRGVTASLTEFRRQPLQVVLLLALPPLVVEAYGRAMASFPALPFLSSMPATLGRINGAAFAAAFLAGLVGLFQVVAAVEADERLELAGYGRLELFARRFLTVLVVSLLAAGTSLAALAWQVDVAAPVAAYGALALGAGLYGLVGMLIAVVLPRELEGSLVLVFVADFDDVLASGIADVDAPLTDLTPLHYPHSLFSAAVTDGAVASGDVVAGTTYLVVLGVVTLAVYVASIGRGGVLP